MDLEFESGRGPFGGLGILALPVGDLSLCLLKHPDDLLRPKALPFHPDLLSGSDPALTLTQNLDQSLGDRTRTFNDTACDGIAQLQRAA